MSDNRDPWSSGRSGGRIKEQGAKILQAQSLVGRVTFLHKCGGHYLRPHYIVLTFGIHQQTAINKKCIDTGLTSGPPWGDGAEEAGEQQEQGHLSDPVARKSRNPLNTVFPLFFLQVLRENSLWTLRERPNGAAQELTALDLAPDRGLLSTANSAVVLIDVFRGGKNPTSAPLILLLFLVFFFFL